MSLICPQCQSPSFQVVDSVECGPSPGIDESTIQRAFCGACDTRFVCSYQAIRSFRPDRDDHETHVACLISHDMWDQGHNIFSPPARRVSSVDQIAAAKALLERGCAASQPAHILYDAKQPQVRYPVPTPKTNWWQRLARRFKTPT